MITGNWECACGIFNGENSLKCGGCGWSREKSDGYKKENPLLYVKNPKKGKGKFFSWHNLFHWEITSDDLKEQVEKYYVLEWNKSYRKLSAVALSIWCIPTIFAVVSANGDAETLLSLLIILLPLIVCTILFYFGNFWAICLMMGIYIIDRMYSMYIDPKFIVGYVIWGSLFMSCFWKTFRVSQARRRIELIKNLEKVRGL